MEIRKLSPNQLANLTPSKKELSAFWKSYFSSLSSSLTKLFFHHLREQVNIRFVHRDVVTVADYFEHLNDHSVLHAFKIYPHNEFGFLHLSSELCDEMVGQMLGGASNTDSTNPRELTKTDLHLLNQFLTHMMDVLLRQFSHDDRTVDFEVIDDENTLMKISSIHAQKLISIQQFSITTPQKTFVFDVAFSSKILDSFSLI